MEKRDQRIIHLKKVFVACAFLFLIYISTNEIQLLNNLRKKYYILLILLLFITDKYFVAVITFLFSDICALIGRALAAVFTKVL